MKCTVFRACFSFKVDSNLFLEKIGMLLSSEVESSKYLVEIILVVDAKDFEEARKVADYIVDIPIPNSEIGNKIDAMRVEENRPDQKPRIMVSFGLMLDR